MLCVHYPRDEMCLVPECTALQGQRGDVPASIQHVPSMQAFMWQEDTVLVSKSVQGAMNMVRAASSGDEMDVTIPCSPVGIPYRQSVLQLHHCRYTELQEGCGRASLSESA